MMLIVVKLLNDVFVFHLMLLVKITMVLLQFVFSPSPKVGRGCISRGYINDWILVIKFNHDFIRNA